MVASGRASRRRLVSSKSFASALRPSESAWHQQERIDLVARELPMSASVCKPWRTRSESQSERAVGKGADGAITIVPPEPSEGRRCLVPVWPREGAGTWAARTPEDYPPHPASSGYGRAAGFSAIDLSCSGGRMQQVGGRWPSTRRRFFDWASRLWGDPTGGFAHLQRSGMAPGGVEPPHADSKSAALSTELRGPGECSPAAQALAAPEVFSAGLPAALTAALGLGVDLGAEQERERGEPEPREHDDHAASEPHALL